MRAMTLVVLLLALSVVGFTQDKPKADEPSTKAHPAPTISDAQRAQLRDYQLADARVTTQILALQKQGQDNLTQFNTFARNLCHSEAGDSNVYQLNLEKASCEKVTPPEKK